jgi:phosphomannomutase
VGSSLRPEIYLDYARAFLSTVHPKRIVLGGDPRASKELLRHLVMSAAIASGVDVLDLGIVSTPTIGLMVRERRCGGGIGVTASHNPVQWNGLKFFGPDGTFLPPSKFEELIRRYEKRDFVLAELNELGRVEVIDDPVAEHLEALLRALPMTAIRRRKFRVVVDMGNGAGLVLAQELCRELGVELGAIFVEQKGKFERKPEPLPENLGRLKRAVKKFGADVGFALDPDADRLAIVDETGRAIGEERTLTLATEWALRQKESPVVTNLSTTRAIDDVAKKYGVRVIRTKIGEAHVIDAMKKAKASIGGEGAGGVIYPKITMGRDAATGIGLTLALMAEEAGRGGLGSLSKINASIPDYVIVKDRIDLPKREAIHAALRALESGLGETAGLTPSGKRPKVDRRDGLKFVYGDRWLHVRASGTEPIMRLYAEAPTRAGAKALVDWAKRRIRERNGE